MSSSEPDIAKIDAALKELWQRFSSTPTWYVMSSHAFERYAADYNMWHRRKISWRRLNRLQRIEAVERYGAPIDKFMLRFIL